jgi:rhodanese-related sulfurtransferase
MRGGIAGLALLAMLGGCATVSTAKKFAEPAIAGADTAESTIDYGGFTALTSDLRDYRAARRVSLDQFQKMAGEGATLILDARSASAFARGHIAGAVNLPFTDFTAQSLKETIGDKNRRVLIYCNNNFANNAQPVLLKAAPLALNIPTFINLYGYGYQNIYELRDVVDFTDPKVGWISSAP